jgi:ketosteroid isomerase-like protein
MSQENVEIVRQAWEAYMRHDNETALALYHPEAELRHPLDGSVYQGLDGVRAFFGDWHAAWSELLANDVEEWIDAGDEVIAAMRIRARGRSSGAVVERREWVSAPRGRHSEKPERFYELIESMYPEYAPWLEMFARRRRDGWVSWGNETP